MTLLSRVLGALHVVRPTPRVTFTRSSADSVSAVADWLKDVVDENGWRVWREDRGRRLLAARLLVLRERFAEAWRRRGGRDG